MKITFIIPDMSWLYDYKAQFSLGLLYISTILKEKGVEVSFYDTNENDLKDIPKADVYGFSVVFNTYDNCVDLARQVKELRPRSKIIVGGVHATLNQYDIDPIFESVFIGEAENTIVKFVEDFETGEFSEYYIDDKPVDLSNLIPDRKLISDDYIRTGSIFTGDQQFDDHGSTAIMFTRGCPYKCTFCASPRVYNRQIRFRDVASIEKEIKGIIKDYGIRQFRIQDDTFTIKQDYLKELCDMMKPLNIFYRCSTRVNHVTEENIKNLYDSGCREIGIGIEVANDEALKQLKKQITVKQCEEAIRIIKKFDITLRCFFMIGTPYDTEQTMQDNIDFIERNDIDGITCANFIPFPGTEMYDKMEDHNISLVKKNTCMNIAKHIEFTPNIIRDDISEKDHLQIMKVFYYYIDKRGFIK